VVYRKREYYIFAKLILEVVEVGFAFCAQRCCDFRTLGAPKGTAASNRRSSQLAAP
jgi:hypothetical protein